MLAPTAVTSSTNGRAASGAGVCATFHYQRPSCLLPLSCLERSRLVLISCLERMDGRADAGTDGGAVPGVVARAESTRRMSVGTPPTPVGCANPGVVTHADPVADDRAASVADDRAAFVANGRVDPVADGRADSGTEVALCSSLALRE